MFFLLWLASIAGAAAAGYAYSRIDLHSKLAHMYAAWATWLTAANPPETDQYQQGRYDGFIESTRLTHRILKPDAPDLPPR